MKEPTVDITHLQFNRIYNAILESSTYFKQRDEMNATIHTSPVKYSPITELTIKALIECEKVRADME